LGCVSIVDEVHIERIWAANLFGQIRRQAKDWNDTMVSKLGVGSYGTLHLVAACCARQVVRREHQNVDVGGVLGCVDLIEDRQASLETPAVDQDIRAARH
jgi:hypothetical protein